MSESTVVDLINGVAMEQPREPLRPVVLNLKPVFEFGQFSKELLMDALADDLLREEMWKLMGLAFNRGSDISMQPIPADENARVM